MVNLRIDPRKSEPIFEQIAFQVKRAVAEGRLHDGDKLPSVRELASELAVNPNTIVRAIELLEREGVIVRRQGAGCFVTSRGAELNGKAKRERLDELIGRAVTEAFHLGCDAQAIRSEFERHLRKLERDES